MPYIFLGFFGILLLTGGASRPDEIHQIVARLAAIVVIAFGVLAMRRADIVQVREVLVFLMVAAAVVAIQLIPLPPSIWASLPGRDQFVPAFQLAGLEPVWRPISLTPDRTMNSLLALLPAFAAVIGMATLDRAHSRTVLLVLVGAVLLAILVGIVQISTGKFYIYRITSPGWAVGLFANRNHQALLLAAAFPLLAAWAGPPAADKQFDQLRSVLAVVMAALLASMLLATGSRAGLALGLAGMLGSVIILLRARWTRRTSWRTRLKFIIPIAAIFLAIAASLYWARDVALQRLLAEDVGDIRLALLPIYRQMLWDFFPIGSGLGSFDPVFRMYEPYELLGPSYVNQAHNDLLQVVMEAGALGAVLIILFLVWFLLRAWRLWTVRGSGERDDSVLLGRAGSVMILLMLAGSAVDYPLRTPLMSFLFVVAAVWMLPLRGGARKGELASTAR